MAPPKPLSLADVARPVTRSHKLNDRDHKGLAAGTAAPEEHLPRYFAKAGHLDADPKKVKKEGGGKGNWGHPGAEAHDYGYTFAQARRRSNSSTQPGLGDFKTKFETVEPEPVFEEELHGAPAPAAAGEGNGEEASRVGSHEKDSSAESASMASVDEEERAR